MDVSKIYSSDNADQAQELHLNSPITGEPVYDEDGRPLTLKLLGRDSGAYTKAEREISAQRVKRASAGGRQAILSPAQIENDQITLLAAVTVGWQAVGLGDKAELEFDEANVRRVYKKCRWIREQAQQFIDDRSNYLGN